MKKQTAVQWLIEKLNQCEPFYSGIVSQEHKQYIDGIIEQALEMEAKQKKLDLTNITRLEVINHASNEHPIGRLLTMYKETEDFTVVEAEFQDGHRTLKIFIS
jgi:hypothetical protein